MGSGSEKKRVISLGYHDVVELATHQTSGFAGADAALYKLEPDQFDRHLVAISKVVSDRPILVTDLMADKATPARPWMITFDDGGVSSYNLIADRLEMFGWRAHFFIATDYIGAPAFMSRGQIRDLHRRGHIIGSHSCSHPLRFASRPRAELYREWKESVSVLSDLLGEQVRVASVPGGQYSRQVAEAAADTRIESLFTSEHKNRRSHDELLLAIGGPAIQRRVTLAVAIGMASDQFKTP